MRNECEWKLSDRLHKFLCDKIYSERYKNWEMTEIADRQRQKTHGDWKFSRGGTIAYIDEKAYSSMWNGCLIELIQDVETKDLGWFFTLDYCTHLICGYYESREAQTPRVVYKMPWPALREKYWELCERDGLWHKGTSRGYGKTIFAVIPWDDVPGLEVLWEGSGADMEYHGKCTQCGLFPVHKKGLCEDCYGANKRWEEDANVAK